jgi:mono/diheme cytochrome c family protein
MTRVIVLSGLLCNPFWIAAAGLVHRAPVKIAVRTNPLEGNRSAELAGAKLYSQECAACHGPNREGRAGPPLRLGEVYQAPSGILFWILRNGSLRTGMPSFAHLPEPQRWQIAAFLHTREKPAPAEHRSLITKGHKPPLDR